MKTIKWGIAKWKWYQWTCRTCLEKYLWLNEQLGKVDGFNRIDFFMYLMMWNPGWKGFWMLIRKIWKRGGGGHNVKNNGGPRF